MIDNRAHINPQAKRNRPSLDIPALFKRLRKGNIAALSQAITLVESTTVSDGIFAQELIACALPFSGSAFRLGITGVPGVGKSTFIESLGKYILAASKKLAVLAIDPSSSISRGSILGDKTRMEALVKSDLAFIRPSPAGTTLGGVARKTREAIILCEAAGYDFIVVETVGVGQSETAVHSMTDFFLLLKLAGAGDDLQGIKRGIMEMADALVINKADGDNQTPAKHASREFKNALHMMPAKIHAWPTQVYLCSGLHDKGVDIIYEQLVAFQEHATQNGHLIIKRNNQELYWLHQTVKDCLNDRFYNNPKVQKQVSLLEQQVLDKVKSPFEAAQELLDLVKN